MNRATLTQSLTIQSTALGVLVAVLVLWAPELGLEPYLEKLLQTIGIIAGGGGIVGLRRAIGRPATPSPAGPDLPPSPRVSSPGAGL